RAKALLNEARAKGDPQMLAEVAQKYLHTEAGAEATNLLGTYYLDRGGYVMAALCYERLLNHPSAGKLPALTLFKAALAFRHAGEQVNADHAWDLLIKNHPEGLRLGDQLVSLDRLHQELVQASLQGSAGLSRSDWPMWGGNAARSAQGYGGAPYLDDQVWPAKQTVHLSQTRTWIEETQDNQRTRGQPVIPAFCPIAATIPTDKGPLPLVIYRTYEKVCAVDARNGEVYWDTLPLLWGLDNLLADPNKQMILNQWRQFYIQASCQNVVYENSVLGTMSTDNSRVYVIDDLALPPHPNYMQQFQWGNQPTFGALKDGVNHNTLEAFELDSGKLAWEVGGKEEDKNDLSGSFFLGPPLPLGGKLYVLNEKKSELRLLCLDPLKKGAVTWTQTLANVKDSLLQDVGRRVQAAQLAYGEGILVCPTNAGAILGVDLLTHSLVWAHSYRQPAPTNPAIKMGGMMVVNPQVLSQDWKASTPIIAEGKVVFTAPDGTLVHCLNLRDGQPLWTANRTDDLYVGGVYNGKVILVGRNSCRALNLTDGKQVWRQDALGTPSGQGVASKNVYYLPLKEGRDKEPEVCALNIDTGAIIAHSKSRKKLNGPTEIPGNLLFFEGDVISQTTTTLTAYPQLDVIRAQIDEHLRKNPQDPVGLTNRGEIKLDEGDWNGAVEDLRTALA
ncbi:MAG: PQQ-binding-like beta-propeller repeat protein, partial [Planctomycetes bacterium]|nr:PQQ-binding-like beta-propeller repeat protein [Planctomycetota bacterium]